jgi:hypothetical protein
MRLLLCLAEHAGQVVSIDAGEVTNALRLSFERNKDHEERSSSTS